MANITAEMQKYLDSLPLKTVQVSGQERMVKYDASTSMAYLLNQDGSYSGKSAKIEVKEKQKAEGEHAPAEAPAPAGSPAVKSDTQAAAKSAPAGGDPQKKSFKEKIQEAQQNQSDAEKKQKKKALIVLGVIGGGLFFMIFLVFILSQCSRKPSAPSVTPNETQSVAETVNVNNLAAAENYHVLIAARNIMPGETLTEDMLTSCRLTKAEYAVSGGAYLESTENVVLGMQATRFIPFGSLLSYDSCTTQKVSLKSPWERVGRNAVILDIPYDGDTDFLEKHMIGEWVNLEISRETVRSTSENEQNVDIEGMQHDSSLSASTQTDRFRFSKIQLVDFLDADMESIYSEFRMFYGVPEGFLPSLVKERYTMETYERLDVQYIRILVTPDQLEEIGNLPADSTSLTLKTLDEEIEGAPVENYAERTAMIGSCMTQRIYSLLAGGDEN